MYIGRLEANSATDSTLVVPPPRLPREVIVQLPACRQQKTRLFMEQTSSQSLQSGMRRVNRIGGFS